MTFGYVQGAESVKLYIANKNYSSWSMRPWLSLHVKSIRFDEALVPFSEGVSNPEFRNISPSGKLPILQDGDTTVWETLAIMEYVADKFPEMRLWPEQLEKRANARSVAYEMNTGFMALRSECPLNMRRRHEPMKVSDGVRKDVSRIVEIWDRCLQQSGGPFLYGEFTNADAMYAPIVNRLAVYCLSEDPTVKLYSDAISALPSWQEWANASKAEPWVVQEDEV